MRRLCLLFAIALLPAFSLLAAETEGEEKDPRWLAGHEYRQWVYDQNFIGDQNSNLDPGIDFIEEGKIRIHSGRVYFYDNLDLAMQLGRETGFPIAFYIFDHQCQTCLYRLGELYFDPTIVAKSRKFINVYVEVPKMRPRLSKLGISNSNLTVQFFLPGMRRLRVLDDAEKENLSHTYDLIFEKYHSLSPEERMKPPRPPKQFRMSPNQYR